MFSSLRNMWHGSTESNGPPRTRKTPKKTRSTHAKPLQGRSLHSVATALLSAVLTDGSALETESTGVCGARPLAHQGQKFGRDVCTQCIQPDENGACWKTNIINRLALKEKTAFFFGVKGKTSSDNFEGPKPRYFVIENSLSSGKEAIIRFQKEDPRIQGKSYGLQPDNFSPKGLIRQVSKISLQQNRIKDTKKGNVMGWLLTITGTVHKFARFSKVKAGQAYSLRDGERRNLQILMNFGTAENPFTHQELLVRLALHFGDVLDDKAKTILRNTFRKEIKERATKPNQLEKRDNSPGVCSANYMVLSDGSAIPHIGRPGGSSGKRQGASSACTDAISAAEEEVAIETLNSTLAKVVCPTSSTGDEKTRRRLVSPLRTLNDKIHLPSGEHP